MLDHLFNTEKVVQSDNVAAGLNYYFTGHLPIIGQLQLNVPRKFLAVQAFVCHKL